MSESARLEYRLNDKLQQVKLVPPTMRIGRDAACEICIPDPGVSRVHALVNYEDDGWTISDSNSRNGMFVNNQKVPSGRLREGDRVHIGNVKLVFSRQLKAPEDSREALLSQISVPDFQESLLLHGRPDDTTLKGTPLRPASDSNREDTAEWALPLFSRAAQALISSVDLRSMLDTVIDLVFEFLPAERACVILYEEDKKEEKLRVGRSKFDRSESPFSISSTILQKTLEQRSSVLVVDSLTDENLAAQQSVILNRIRSAMCAPLYNDDKVAGIIYIDTASGQKPFSHAHLQVLTTLAFLSAAAVQKAQLRDDMRAEQEIRRRLERYSAPSVVDRIIQSDEEAFTEEVDASVLFLDFVRFTGLSEKLPTREVLEILNSVLTEMTECVFQYEGTLDKFTGDGLMAIFGAPLAQEDHALRAVRTALGMKQSLEQFNTQQQRESLQMRVGINSGVVIAGDVGSPRRTDYTVIGDVVNTASRLESQVAQPGQVVIGERTYEQVKEHVLCEGLGSINLKGRQQELTAYLAIKPR